MKKLQFNYNRISKSLYPEVIEIDNLGDFIIQGVGEQGTKYLIAKTQNGYTRVITVDPLKKISFKMIEFNETKMINQLKRFLSVQDQATVLEVSDYIELMNSLMKEELLLDIMQSEIREDIEENNEEGISE